MSNLLEKCLNNKMMCSGIFIFIVIIIVLVIYFSTSSSSTSSSSSSTSSSSSSTSTNIPTTTALYNKSVVDAAILSSGIKTTIENFQNNIIYNSVDIIKQNFNNFMNTYYPILDINILNKMLKDDYNVDKTIQEILNEHPETYFNNYLMILVGFSLFFNILLDTQTDIILSGLGYITVMKLNLPAGLFDIYYLNDFEKEKDFIVYYIPPTFDKTKITNTNKDIELKTLNEKETITIQPFKIGLNNNIIENIKLSIIDANEKQGNTSSSTEPNSNEINNFINIFKSNKNSILRYIRLMLIAPFIKLHTNVSLTSSSKISTDMVDLFTSNKYFTSDIIKYLPPIEETNNFYITSNFIFMQPLSDLGPNTTPSRNIIYATTLPDDTTNTDIIKLYSGENFTGSVQIFDIRNALSHNSENYILSVYNSSTGAPPPKSYQIIQPLNTTSYYYFIDIEYVGSDKSSLGIFTYNNNDNMTIINPTQVYMIKGQQISGTLENIIVYKQFTPTEITFSSSM